MAARQAVRASGAAAEHKKEAVWSSFDVRCPLRMAMRDEHHL